MDAIWIGIDVSKRCLDVAVRPAGEILKVDNDETGIKKLVRLMTKWSPQRIVLEATGGHEYAAAYALMKAGLPVAVVNPRQVRDFARAVGKLAKTDPIDARILAHFGEAVQPPARPVPDQQLDEIGHLVTRHRQLIEMMVAEGNRRMSSRGAAQRDIDTTIRFFRTPAREGRRAAAIAYRKASGLECQSGVAAFGSRCRTGFGQQYCGRTSGAWHVEPKTDRCAGGSGAIQQ